MKSAEKSMEFWQRQKAWEEEQLKLFSVCFHTFLSGRCHSKSWWASRRPACLSAGRLLRLKRCETTPETWGLHCQFHSGAPSCCHAVRDYALIWECWQFKSSGRKPRSGNFRWVLIENTEHCTAATVKKYCRQRRMLAHSATHHGADSHTEIKAQMLSIIKGLGVIHRSHQAFPLFNYSSVCSHSSCLQWVRKYESWMRRLTTL